MKSKLVAAEIAEPYAQALMSVAQKNDLVDRFSEDVNSLLNLLKESPEFLTFLENPLVSDDTKKGVLNQVLGEGAHPFLANFLRVLVDRRRIFFIEDVCQQFQTLVRQLRKSVLAEVTSAVNLSQDQQEGIRQKVLAMTGSAQVELDLRVDPALMGGVIIKVGSQVVDASLRGQLRRIGMRLSAG
ncbi:MAG: ATP synthase F1 subunit delta [Oculatellaceae cyanobacterium Prado106]|jgi:F-type H+-transporting ATPase subunit delta|nr:ATP synthase F1 subunit delta [Oculatellaceae cyanobacterium Prado106]